VDKCPRRVTDTEFERFYAPFYDETFSKCAKLDKNGWRGDSMPDWSYHTLFKPVLQKLPPTFSREFIHRGMSTIASTLVGEKLIEFLGHLSPSKNIQKQLFHIPFSTPVGLSGKVDPQLTGLKAFQNLGFGFVEIGPVSIQGSIESEVLHVDLKKEQIWSDSPPSIQLTSAKMKLASLKKKKIPFFIKVEGTEIEIKQICEELSAYSDGFILNSQAFISETRFEQFRKDIKKPIILSCSNDDVDQIDKDFKADGILLEEDDCPETLYQHLVKIREMVGDDIPIITSGGIREPSDAIRLLEKGASLVLLGYDYVFAGPGLPKRINEAYSKRTIQESRQTEGWKWYWLFGFAIMIAGLIAMIFSMTTIILPYDEAFLGLFRKDIIDYNPLILYFMAHDRMTLSGTMISGGIIYMQLARYGIRYGLHWARKATNTAAITGFLGILLFIGYGYFDWLHGLFWLILLPLFIIGFVKSRNATESPSGTNQFNHPSWKWSLYGQLSFILLGASLSVGGVVISFIGASSVFVATDIIYICMTPEVLNEFNERLIPVIAHDRAGFGSALLSVGLLVLMLALWGIREGERWVWWTFTIGAIPAFAAGIATHYFIGYTTFIHLLPAYVALLLYVVGVICTGPFLLKRA
jgi:dihydroorotate dehydrogenase